MAGGRAEDIQQRRVKRRSQAAEQAAEAAVPSPASPTSPRQTTTKHTHGKTSCCRSQAKVCKSQNKFFKRGFSICLSEKGLFEPVYHHFSQRVLKIKALTFATGERVVSAPLTSVRHHQSCSAGRGANSWGLQGQGCALPSSSHLLRGRLAPPPSNQTLSPFPVSPGPDAAVHVRRHWILAP